MKVLIVGEEIYPVYFIIAAPDNAYSEQRFEREAVEVPDELVERYNRVKSEWDDVQGSLRGYE